MLKKRPTSILKDEKGMAMFEMIPIILVIVLFINFALGFFGAVHTGILNSIAARNYAFGTFNHRSNVTYFRSTNVDQAKYQYKAYHMRIHGVSTESSNSEKWLASTRKIDFFDFQQRVDAVNGTSGDVHNKQVNTILDNQRNDKVSINPIWIKTSYGICLDAQCGT